MRYLFLVYLDEGALDRMAPDAFDALVRDSLAYDDYLRDCGKYIASDALQPVRTATTLRMPGDDVLTTDGPFAETKEQLGGFFLVEADNLDEATQLAAKCPCIRHGSIEVRPVKELV
ncbi:YciI family protein [Pacificispira sp.]|uniref:YciI family protein n=1 Tax=Pacificispira sp. TaxID=2888761 RepID=UPI003BAB76D1